MPVAVFLSAQPCDQRWWALICRRWTGAEILKFKLNINPKNCVRTTRCDLLLLMDSSLNARNQSRLCWNHKLNKNCLQTPADSIKKKKRHTKKKRWKKELRCENGCGDNDKYQFTKKRRRIQKSRHEMFDQLRAAGRGVYYQVPKVN